MLSRYYNDYYEDRPRLPLEDIPSNRVPRFSSRSTISDRASKFGSSLSERASDIRLLGYHDAPAPKGNTFPTRSAGSQVRQHFGNWDGRSVDGAGRRSFPRYVRPQPQSRSSLGTSSYGAGRASRASSSSESGMVPDLCDSPECRYCGIVAAMCKLFSPALHSPQVRILSQPFLFGPDISDKTGAARGIWWK